MVLDEEEETEAVAMLMGLGDRRYGPKLKIAVVFEEVFFVVMRWGEGERSNGTLSPDVGDENIAFVEFDVRSSSDVVFEEQWETSAKTEDLVRVPKRDDEVIYPKWEDERQA